ADTHAFDELRLLSQLRSRPTTLNEDEMASLRRIIGGSGTDAASRLGLQPDTPYDGPRAAFAAAQRWRRRADHPLNDPFTTRACRAQAAGQRSSASPSGSRSPSPCWCSWSAAWSSSWWWWTGWWSSWSSSTPW